MRPSEAARLPEGRIRRPGDAAPPIPAPPADGARSARGHSRALPADRSGRRSGGLGTVAAEPSRTECTAAS